LTTASLGRMVRDHRTGEVHIPHEPVAILGITMNLGRTLFKVKWQAGGESILLADDFAEYPPAQTADKRQSVRFAGGDGAYQPASRT
jgi:hypothetical protein